MIYQNFFRDTEILFELIVREDLRFPKTLSSEAISVLKGFLTKNPSERFVSLDVWGFTELIACKFI